MRNRKRSKKGNSFKFRSSEGLDERFKFVPQSKSLFDVLSLESKIMEDKCSSILFSNTFLDLIRERNSLLYSKLNNISSIVCRRIKGLRLGRTLNETVPKKFDELSFGQLQYFVKRILKIVFGSVLLNEEECETLSSYFTSTVLSVCQRSLVYQSEYLFKLPLVFEKSLPRRSRFEVRKNVISALFQFCFTVIRKTFFVSEQQNRMKLYRRDVWRDTEASESQKRGLVVVSDKPCGKWLRFIKKTNGCRPIVTGYSMEEKEMMNAVIAVIKFVFNAKIINNISITDFKQFLPLYYAFRDKNHGKTLYYATIDLTDCFGSVKRKEVYEALKKLFYTKRDYHVAVGCLGYGKQAKLKASASFVKGVTAQRLKKKGFKSIKEHTLSSEFILNYVNEKALQMPFTYKNKSCFFKDGVLQGHPMSPILSNIWVCLQEHGQIFKDPEILVRRYVDDYVFVSTKKEDIIKCLQHFNNKTLFKWSKISCNFAQDFCKERTCLSWCGYSFDTEINQMTLDMDRYSAKAPRHPQIFFKNQANARKQFEAVIDNCLKFYMKTFSLCYKFFDEVTRKTQRQRFLFFIYSNVLMAFAKKLKLQRYNKVNRTMMKNKLREISRLLPK